MISKIKLVNNKKPLMASYIIFFVYVLFIMVYNSNTFLYNNKILINNIFLIFLLTYLFFNFLYIIISIKNKRFSLNGFLKLYKKRIQSIYMLKLIIFYFPFVAFFTFFFRENHKITDSNFNYAAPIITIFSINLIIVLFLLVMLVCYKTFKRKNSLIDFEPISFLFFDILLNLSKLIKPVFLKIRKIKNYIKKSFESFYLKHFCFVVVNVKKIKIFLSTKKGNEIPLF